MSRLSTTIVGEAGGAIALLLIVVGFVWFCILQCRKLSSKRSETSSDPPAIELKREGVPSSSEASQLYGPHGARQFTMEELGQATKNFDDSNLIGHGSFGLVFKGLLNDGTVVAIKRLYGVPRQEFAKQAFYLSRIQHRNLVTLLGYCQENGYQMLVFECILNGSMCSHLYDTGKGSATKLEFKQRLSIALGAAKGLCHLHSQLPALVHGNFKTANVLVDENFTAKVADAGISKLFESSEDAGPSFLTSIDIFKDAEVDQMRIFTEMNDIHSFGIFLLELITGHEASSHIESFGSNESIVQRMEMNLSSNDFLDHRMAGAFTQEGIQNFIRLMIRCINFPGKERPKMEMVVFELNKILENETMLTTVTGDGTATVTLGSHLFTK